MSQPVAAPTTEHVRPPGLAVTVYEVAGAPVSGWIVIDAIPSPTTTVGANGGGGIKAPDVATFRVDADPLPTATNTPFPYATLAQLGSGLGEVEPVREVHVTPSGLVMILLDPSLETATN